MQRKISLSLCTLVLGHQFKDKTEQATNTDILFCYYFKPSATVSGRSALSSKRMLFSSLQVTGKYSGSMTHFVIYPFKITSMCYALLVALEIKEYG